MRRLLVLVLCVGCSGSSTTSSGEPDPEPSGGGETAPCEEAACGPALGMPNQLCPDGTSTSGPTGRCIRNADGSCGWEISECPADGASSTGAGAGAACGSRGLPPCGAGTFCDFPAGSQCGATDAGGQCVAIPSACTREYMPVCGCDGQTYATRCTANAASVSVAHDGPC